MKSLFYLLLTLMALPKLGLCEAIDDFVVMPALPDLAPIPQDNPQTSAKIALGKQLYFDTRLSVTNKVSCNTCHDLAQGGVDHLPFSTGALGKTASRSTPTVLNAAFQSVQFWDGRAESLEAAVRDHLLDPVIMGMPDEQTTVARLNHIDAYHTGFAIAFAGAFDRTCALSAETVAQAIAAYLRTLITPNSAFDRFIKGETEALDAQARRGMEEFQSVGCVACHFGTNFSGPPVPMGEGFYELFPNYVGSQFDQKYELLGADLGRYEVTKETIHKRLWRVPSLRNIALTAPYFHNGSAATLNEAIRVMAKTQLEQGLSDRQVDDIAAFLTTLTGELPVQHAPTDVSLSSD